MKKYINCNAMKRSDLAADIESKTIPVMNALAQLYYFPDNINKKHWRQEVWASFHRIQRLKRSNKLPNKEFVLLNSIECNRDQFGIVKKFIIDKESEFSPDPIRFHNDSTFKDLVTDYFEWLAAKFEIQVQIPQSEVYEELDYLGL